MAIVVIRQDDRLEEWVQALAGTAPDIRIYNYLEDHPRDEVEMAIVWKHPANTLNAYPKLRCVASSGAGVDFIFEDPDLPDGVLVSRVVDPWLAGDMSEFVIAQVFGHMKHLNRYRHDQLHKKWHPAGYRRSEATTVGILGMGALGTVLASDLIKLNFKVVGWANSPKNIPGITVYSGSGQLHECLARTDILVCLLPLTPKTRGILNRKLFMGLPRGAYIINVARGGHLVDDDLLEMIDKGHLSGASLDVFHREPLPPGHPFWEHHAIHITPHIASVSDIGSVVPQLLENYRRLQSGRPLLNPVSFDRGY